MRLICSALLVVKNIEKFNAFERKRHGSVNVYSSQLTYYAQKCTRYFNRERFKREQTAPK